MLSPKYTISLLCLIVLSACSSYKQGFKKYAEGKYTEAIPLLEKASKGTKKTMAKYYTGQSYRKSNQLAKAEPYYADIADKNIPALPLLDDHKDDAKLYYGLALKANGKHEEAKEQLEKYINVATSKSRLKRAQQELKSLESIDEIKNLKTHFQTENCNQLNTAAAEFAPMIYGPKTMLFSSTRKKNTFGGTGQKYAGIYQYDFTGNACEGEAKVFDPSINLPEINEATTAISPDGKTLIFARSNAPKTTKKNPTRNVKLYISHYNGEAWSQPKLLEGVSQNDNSKDGRGDKALPKSLIWDSTPCFSADGKVLYFSSSRQFDDKKTRSQGGIDLFSASKRPDGSWGNVRNLGSTINTAGNELFPFVSKQKELYFASDGHPSLGGLDIFKATRVKGVTTITNMGIPINSDKDDFALIYKDEKSGFFSSNRQGGKGDDDIYSFIDETPEETENPTYYLAFKTIAVGLDQSEKIFPNAKIQVLGTDDKVIKEFVSDDQGLTPAFKIPVDASYICIARNQNPNTKYLATRQKFSIQDNTVNAENIKQEDGKVTMTQVLKLQQFEVSKTTFEYEILFDYSKWDIRPDAAGILDGIVTFLHDNPEVKVELGAHTDARGTAANNEKLAQHRAQSSVDYIVSKGIDPSRIKPQGYGENAPKVANQKIAQKYGIKEGQRLNETLINTFKNKEKREALHQLNRRTEIKIIGVVKSK